MRIISSFMDDVVLEKGKYHAFSFESSFLLKRFKQHLFAYFNNKPQSEVQFLNILDFENNEIKAKNFHFISFDCHHIDLKVEKSTKAQIQKFLFHQLENNPELLKKFTFFQNEINYFTDNLELTSDNLSIEFKVNEKVILNFIKSLEIIIEHEGSDYIPNYKIRAFLIKTLLKMNSVGKEPILLISYPETDVGKKEYNIVIKTLKKLDVTIMVLSSQKDILTAAEDDHLFLVNQNGGFYDIINLRRELKLFNIILDNNPNNLVRLIALADFNRDYQLLNEKIKDFLMSDKL